MRLLNTKDLKFTEFRDDSTPAYVTASHRWLSEDEATYQDIRDGHNTKSAGYQKIEAFARYIRESLPTIEWLWIDTCCINKDSAAELSEAINSMFEWYSGAELCLAYLADVHNGDVLRHFEKSEWFKRGWTLQELLAPRTVMFVTNEWHVIGYKGGSLPSQYNTFTGACLDETIARITGIPEQVLHDYQAGRALSVHAKLKWMDGRKTTKPEDMSYALFGILGVTLPAIYGEKYEGARQRLVNAIHQRDSAAAEQAEYLRRIANWLSPTDPWTFHESVRQRHEPDTGTWLLQHNQYLAWKSGRRRSLWVYGKAGCGKTVLSSTTIEDIRRHCQRTPNVGHAIFYFSFSDSHKQTYQNLMLSLVAQLGWHEPGLTMLKQAYEQVQQKQPRIDELQNILLSSISSFDRVFLHLDALDECPEKDEVRQNVLDGVTAFLEHAPNVHMLVTSRDVPDVRSFVQGLGGQELPIAAKAVDADIQKYVSTQLSRVRKLCRLDSATKKLIEETLAQKADGMFRWAYCQLVELTKSKDTRRKSIEAALLALPKDLDETYQRILRAINEYDRPFALTLIRWIAYAKSPLSLAELSETSLIKWMDDEAEDCSIDEDNRADYNDVLETLADLIIVEGAGKAERGDHETIPVSLNDESGYTLEERFTRSGQKTKIRLAHFSVKEYLESSRILTGEAKSFHLDPAREHRFITQSCLSYLSHYSDSCRKTRTKQDLDVFPLLKYAAQTWGHHALRQRQGSIARELSILACDVKLRDWLTVHDPQDLRDRLFTNTLEGAEEDWDGLGTGLYYASLLGLEEVARHILDAGEDVDAEGGYFGSALAAASYGGYKKIVLMLLSEGASVDAQGIVGTALHATAMEDHTDVMQILIQAGADVNISQGYCDTALQAAAETGHESAVQMLLEAGAVPGLNVGEGYGSALHAASAHGHKNIVRMLINAGADMHDGESSRPSAYSRARGEMQQVMLAAEAEVKERTGDIGNVYEKVSFEDNESSGE